MAAKNTSSTNEITSSVAKTDDGTIQITFTIPQGLVKTEKDNVITETVKTAEVSGFRKGKAPKSKVEEQISEKDLRTQVVNNLIPKAFNDVVTKNKIRPAIYPRVEIVSAEEDKPWEVRAVTCEIPEIQLGDYKKAIKGDLSAKTIWTPEKGKAKDKDDKGEPTQMEKEQIVIETLVKTTKIEIPNILVEAEVSENLSALLEKLDKLGLTLDGYLGSIKKTPTELREEYEQRAKDTLIMTLALNKIAEEENITVTDKEVESALETSGINEKDPQATKTEDQKNIVASILKRRKTLEFLTNLA